MATNTNRPTSPHLQVYKLPLTAVISITHRITGVWLSSGLIFIVYILYAGDGGSGTYPAMQVFMNPWLVQLLYCGFIFAFFFHLCHGVRHLIFWGAGKSFELETLHRYALVELGCAAVLTWFTLILTSE